MKKISFLFAAAGALLATSASAAPLAPQTSPVVNGNVEQVRLICNEHGRCWRSHRGVVVRESLAYAPRARDIERRHDHQDGARVGVGVSPGVGVSVGVGHDRW